MTLKTTQRLRAGVIGRFFERTFFGHAPCSLACLAHLPIRLGLLPRRCCLPLVFPILVVVLCLHLVFLLLLVVLCLPLPLVLLVVILCISLVLRYVTKRFLAASSVLSGAAATPSLP